MMLHLIGVQDSLHVESVQPRNCYNVHQTLHHGSGDSWGQDYIATTLWICTSTHKCVNRIIDFTKIPKFDYYIKSN